MKENLLNRLEDLVIRDSSKQKNFEKMVLAPKRFEAVVHICCENLKNAPDTDVYILCADLVKTTET